MMARRIIAGRNSFSPKALFANGEQGCWFDPSDLSTLYQDVEGTTPVTDAGQPVGKMLDKSGRGHHAVAPGNNTTRPTLVNNSGLWYLSFDGSNDRMEVADIGFDGLNKLSLFAGLQKLSDTAVNGLGSFIEYGITGGTGVTDTAFFIAAPDYLNVANSLKFVSKGLSGTASYLYTNYLINTKSVACALANMAEPIVYLRHNGNQVGSSDNSQGSSYKNHKLGIGARYTNACYFKGYCYGIIIRGAFSTASEIAKTETWLNMKTMAF